MADAIKARNLFARKPLSQARLKELLRYDPDSGGWTRIDRARFAKRHGDKVGYILPAGHRVLSVDGRDYRSTHLAFLYVTGTWPKDQVDHKNCIPNDDRWDNLRQATEGENRRNTHAYKNNTTGFKGVARHGGRFRASITYNWKQLHLGVFDTPEEAHAAYAAKAKELFGEFARTK